jgi:hypothetical protein
MTTNSPAPTFDAEQARLAAAAHLQPVHFVEFQRLAKSLIHGPQFQLLIVDCRDERLRAKVLESLALIQQQAGLRGAELVLDDSVGDVQALEYRLVDLAAEHQVIHVLGAGQWMNAERWELLNLLRERLSVAVGVRLVFWLNDVSIVSVVNYAPDIWAWRSGVYVFPVEKQRWNESGKSFSYSQNGVAAGLVMPENSRINRHLIRAVELSNWLNASSNLPREMREPLLVELVDVLEQVNDMLPRAIGIFAPSDLDIGKELWHAIYLSRGMFKEAVFPNKISLCLEGELKALWSRVDG